MCCVADGLNHRGGHCTAWINKYAVRIANGRSTDRRGTAQSPASRASIIQIAVSAKTKDSNTASHHASTAPYGITATATTANRHRKITLFNIDANAFIPLRHSRRDRGCAKDRCTYELISE